MALKSQPGPGPGPLIRLPRKVGGEHAEALVRSMPAEKVGGEDVEIRRTIADEEKPARPVTECIRG